MIRAVLVGHAVDDWRLYRQSQWMAEVRRSPDASRWPRRHFDVPEDAYQAALDTWGPEAAGSSLEAAIGLLGRLGAIEVTRP